MALGVDRYASRGDTFVFVGCIALSLVALSLPQSLQEQTGGFLRKTILLPLIELQHQSELWRTSRARFQAVTAERDSAALAAAFLGDLRAENERLRGLLGLGQRLGTGFVPAEVLHQSLPTDPLTVLVSAGTHQGVRPLATVVTPEGLLGIVSKADAGTSIVATWAHPEFRASAMAADGSVFGILAPHGSAGGTWLLELRGVPYGQNVAAGTTILTSGLGGILARGIPVGTVVGVAGETEWERTYLVRPAVPPGAVSHVMILTSRTTGAEDLHDAFQHTDSVP